MDFSVHRLTPRSFEATTLQFSQAEARCARTAANPLTAAEEMACDYLTGWAITFNVTASECITPTDRDVTVRITALASDAFMVDFLDIFQGDLVAEVTMRREEACPVV